MNDKKYNIKSLRKLGGNWVAEQIGFGYYRYVGEYKGHKIELQDYSHCEILESGFEDFYSRTHIYVDGKNEYICYPSSVMFYLELQLFPKLNYMTQKVL